MFELIIGVSGKLRFLSLCPSQREILLLNVSDLRLKNEPLRNQGRGIWRKGRERQSRLWLRRFRSEEIQKGLEQEGNIADIDTDDEVNEAEEYEAWKAREIARIKRDREDREAMIKEKEEIERVRNMTEEERRDWERKHPKAAPQPKQKWRFMQKYYHKGAFFQSEPDDYAATVGTDGIYTRDFSAPTGEDKMDKTILPKVMQVKHFGRSGRTKWTHLVNEDTTDWNNP
ncbi:microfibrillar-associated protein 1-like [Prunus yedoensis var. nudiflora]|uniref:Microfibrillar-associated protein 1-like n=1 Tax=Prunus yedoensis var. nudiflora TaxID=2094558 RepID=A0A314YS05_PRUYE|nr:microfibrillar-associated protein 1-like [Prunus yedoensis var. nudiflora]